MILERFLLTDRVAVVTAAGRGIGAAIAEAFAEAGADVVLAARTRQQLDQVAARVDALGRRAVVVPCDLNDLESVAAIIDAAVTSFGRIDVVVNGVGGSPPRPFLQTSERALERAFHFNVTTAFALSRAATPHLLEADGGSIINITSAISRLTDRGFAAYGTAKAALAHLTRLLAADLAPRVRVNAVAPGSIATEALDSVLDDDLRARMEAGTPLRRIGQPHDIAAAALYLASPAAAYVTGKILEVDGGIEAPNLVLGLPDL